MCCCAGQTCTLTDTDISDNLFYSTYKGDDDPCESSNGGDIVLNADKPASTCKFQCADNYFRVDNGQAISFTCDNEDDRTSLKGVSNIDSSNFGDHRCAGDLCSGIVC